MNEDRNFKIATVVLSGYGDNDNSVSALMIDLTFIHQHYIKDRSEGVFRFPFNYSASNRRQETFVSFNELRNRFTKFLRNNGLLESDVVIDIVGYSQGGMIALYSAGLNKNIREHIRKYVSIASPHGGAQNLNLLTLLDLLPFVIFPMISWIPGLIARRVLSKGGTAQLVGNQPSFLRDSYPEAAKKVFAEIPSKNMLQIWSPHDNVAYESSCKRFVTGDFKYDGPDRDFKGKMIPYETDIKLHTAIPQKREVREKVIDFLYKDIIEIEKLSRLLPHIETEKHSGVPGEKIQIESPYFGFYDDNYSYSVTIDDEPVESILENGKLYFKIPDISQGEKVVQVIFGNIPDLQQVESDTLPFIIQPHITKCLPQRALPGEKIIITGEFLMNNDISVYLEDNQISDELSQKQDGVEVTIPENMPDGKKKIKIQCDGRYSNALDIIICNRLGNARTGELHLLDCPLINRINQVNKLPLSVSHDQPKDNGYDACHWCHIRNPDEMGYSKTNLVYLGRQFKCPHCNMLIDLESKK